ncbi:MAG: response regulator [Candidatus Altiarchaeales archaeon ex4484_96]|nr:MAG: response regulator [Candidatus Altiarchaeales archaeon ex4484_96]
MTSILVIEDSIFERKAITGHLKRLGYIQITEASNGEEGLKIAKEKIPDIILLDLRMPGMDGMDVIEELKKHQTNIKIIVVSIIRNKRIVEKCLGLGADDYLSKPVSQEKLKEKIDKVLGSGS